MRNDDYYRALNVVGSIQTHGSRRRILRCFLFYNTLVHEQEDNTRCYNTVYTKGAKGVLLQVVDERFNGDHGDDKCDDVAHQQVNHVLRVEYGIGSRPRYLVVVIALQQFVTCSSHHGRHCEEEGKFGSKSAGEFLLHTTNDGGRTAAGAGYHSKYLPQPYHE